MADRQTKRTEKNSDGDITGLCGDWGSATKSEAIGHIEKGTHTYYVRDGAGRSEVRVVNGATGKYLRSDPDGSSKDNLDSLPDC